MTIRLTFPAARYHATPWGRHVNEGVAEWPPSPYRFLRALYDVWQRKCDDLTADQVQAVLEKLGSLAPRFFLSRAVATHTRSYLSANSKDPMEKNLVFDPFLAFERPNACFLSWLELELSPSESETLERLLANLNYLGRSESWVDASLWPGPVEGIECAADGGAESGLEAIQVACPVPASEHKGKGTWMDTLTYSTSDMLKEKASSPPSLRFISYGLSEGSVTTDPVRRMRRPKQTTQAVMLGLDATVLPLVTATVEVAEQIRVRLMGSHRRKMGGDEQLVSPKFSGKDSTGGKRLDHGHIYILPLAARPVAGDSTREGRIDRVLILSPIEPFDESELDAVRGVRELYQSDGRPMVRCVVTWQGSVEAARQRSGRIVESATPFVPPRHWRRGRDWNSFLQDEVRRECDNHRVARQPVGVEVLETMQGRFHTSEYRRNRKKDPVRPGYALRLTFEEPVMTPFSLGYGAHFGLGQFEAVFL